MQSFCRTCMVQFDKSPNKSEAVYSVEETEGLRNWLAKVYIAGQDDTEYPKYLCKACNTVARSFFQFRYRVRGSTEGVSELLAEGLREISRKNLQLFCRTCLKKLQPTDDAINVLETPHVKQWILTCLEQKVESDDFKEFPRMLCPVCSKKLKTYFEFCENSRQSHAFFLTLLHTADSSSSPVRSPKDKDAQEQSARETKPEDRSRKGIPDTIARPDPDNSFQEMHTTESKYECSTSMITSVDGVANKDLIDGNSSTSIRNKNEKNNEKLEKKTKKRKRHELVHTERGSGDKWKSMSKNDALDTPASSDKECEENYFETESGESFSEELQDEDRSSQSSEKPLRKREKALPSKRIFNVKRKKIKHNRRNSHIRSTKRGLKSKSVSKNDTSDTSASTDKECEEKGFEGESEGSYSEELQDEDRSSQSSEEPLQKRGKTIPSKRIFNVNRKKIKSNRCDSHIRSSRSYLKSKSLSRNDALDTPASTGRECKANDLEGESEGSYSEELQDEDRSSQSSEEPLRKRGKALASKRICNVNRKKIKSNRRDSHNRSTRKYKSVYKNDTSDTSAFTDKEREGIDFEGESEDSYFEEPQNEDSSSLSSEEPSRKKKKAHAKKRIAKVHREKIKSSQCKSRVQAKHGDQQKHFQCAICGIQFRTHNHLRRHIREVHVAAVDAVKKPSKTSKPKSTQNLEIRKFECKNCHKIFKRKEHLKDHYQSVHLNIRPFTCSYCTKSFASRKTHRVHEMRHTGERPYECDKCNKAFRQKSKLKIHMETHTETPELLCHICKRVKKSLEELDAHIKRHQETQRHQCSKCGWVFKKVSHLKEHDKAVHLKLRPYKCSHCDVSFALAKTCRTHERIHTGERPEVCKLCGKSFKQKSVLANHVKRYHTQE